MAGVGSGGHSRNLELHKLYNFDTVYRRMQLQRANDAHSRLIIKAKSLVDDQPPGHWVPGVGSSLRALKLDSEKRLEAYNQQVMSENENRLRQNYEEMKQKRTGTTTGQSPSANKQNASEEFVDVPRSSAQERPLSSSSVFQRLYDAARHSKIKHPEAAPKRDKHCKMGDVPTRPCSAAAVAGVSRGSRPHSAFLRSKNLPSREGDVEGERTAGIIPSTYGQPPPPSRPSTAPARRKKRPTSAIATTQTEDDASGTTAREQVLYLDTSGQAKNSHAVVTDDDGILNHDMDAAEDNGEFERAFDEAAKVFKGHGKGKRQLRQATRPQSAKEDSTVGRSMCEDSVEGASQNTKHHQQITESSATAAAKQYMTKNWKNSLYAVSEEEKLNHPPLHFFASEKEDPRCSSPNNRSKQISESQITSAEGTKPKILGGCYIPAEYGVRFVARNHVKLQADKFVGSSDSSALTLEAGNIVSRAGNDKVDEHLLRRAVERIDYDNRSKLRAASSTSPQRSASRGGRAVRHHRKAGCMPSGSETPRQYPTSGQVLSQFVDLCVGYSLESTEIARHREETNELAVDGKVSGAPYQDLLRDVVEQIEERRLLADYH